MINSKLIKVLKILKPAELPCLIDFVQSPYFNKKTQLTLMCKLLCDVHPKFETAKIDKKYIHNNIFPNAPYDEKQLGYLQSDLTKLVLKFICLEKLEEKQASISLIEELADRKLHALYQKEIRDLRKKLLSTKNKGANYYKFNFELFDLEDRYFITKNERKDDSSAHLASENLDLFYVCKKLQYYTVLLNRKQTLGKKIVTPNMDFVLHYAKTNFNTHPIVNAYYEAIMMQTKEESLPHFYKLKETIQQHKEAFSSKEIAEIYEEAINYCIQRISYNQEFYIDEALKLYMQFLDSGDMYQNGFLSHWKFKNIIKLGLMLERFDFVEQFIVTYSEKIEPSHRTKALHYNFAELHFAMHNYSKAQEYLSQVFLNDLELAYNLGSRMMLIKIFYHNNEMEALLSQIAAFTIFLKRAKNISNTKKKIYLNFCDLLNKILRQNPKHYVKIKSEIKDAKLITASSWLLKVYQEMMPKALAKLG